MLEKVVLYDRVSCKFNVKPFSTMHLKVDQDFLDSTKLPEEKRKRNYSLFEFGKTYFLDPANCQSHLNLLKKAVPLKSHSKIIKSIESHSGLFLSKFGFGSVDPYVKVLMNLSPLLRKFNYEKLQKDLEFEVGKLYFFLNLRKSKICKMIGMTKNKLDKIIRRYNYKSGNLLNDHIRNAFTPDQILLINLGNIMKHIKRTSFRMKSIVDQLLYLRKKIPEMERVNYNTYLNFLKDRIGLKYRQFNRSYSNPDKKQLIKVRKQIALTLARLHSRDCIVIFFDSSSFCDDSFKKYMWTLGGHQSNKVQIKKIQGYTNLFLATSTEKILNYWIVKKVNSVTTASFIYETIRKCRNIYGHRKIVVFMDNARIHKTKLMKDLSRKLNVYFLLNAPYSSKINQVEYVFELIKRPMRSKNSKGYRTGLVKYVKKRMNEIDEISLRHQTLVYWKYLLYAVKKQKFWSKNK